ncbi:LysR family transcriptional regulator [Flexibacterium corallicola]|uniref:LysR family transcriptional regulator n=1 Tax=Flexibacterium corallicola TaxID=3037259 RepID=UPI00286EC2BC|nr:LysR family transcriptional regulator [Pseudovibrio sp. M1P-2-3]
MKSLDLNSLHRFYLAVKLGSLAKTASVLKVSPATMSRSLTQLEDELGSKLIHRNSKQFRLTAEGERYYSKLSPLLEQLDEDLAVLQDEEYDLSGKIRFSCPETLYISQVHAWICEFMQLHPKVRIEVAFTYSEQDHISSRIDLGITLNSPQAPELVQRKLLEKSYWIAAAPDYLSRVGTPQNAGELAQFDTIGMDSEELWIFEGAGKDRKVAVQHRLALHSLRAIVDSAILGLGICRTPKNLIAPAIREGKLVRVLEYETVKPQPLYLVTTHRKLIPARVRSLRDFIQRKAKSDLRQWT